ncbi:MAG TPA: serine/threonine-protein kinase, partial [Myxococcota bacterium]
MGRILIAEQVSIGREVAVKVAATAARARSSAGSRSSTVARTDIVIEARVAGQLEHPNIVPVHILGLADGEPAIVMKRIEGETWKSLLKSGRDLHRDVAILVDVCRALHFAQTRGVVHRDVKPQNVMVGSFGEVYLLDWGIAVGFGPHTIAELPHARDVASIAGTPSYMAPEMAFPDGSIDQRTDVYLAGAVLFEIATGHPPRSRQRIDDALFQAHTAAPLSLPADTPDELVAIIEKAMARDQADRFQCADELRTALVHFQSHAAAREVCVAAEERLAELRGLIASASSAVPDDARLQRAFNECRFGFALALRTWPGSARAQAGHQRALVAMAEHDVARGQLDAARALLADLARPPRDLVDALERASATLAEKRAAEQASVAKLEHIAHESDVNFAGRERAVITVLCGSGWFAMMFAMDLLARYDIYRAGSGTFAALVASLAVVLGIAGVVMPRIRATAVSRSLHTSLVVGVAGIALLHAIGFSFGVPPAPMLALGHLVLSVSLLT